jgi:hypothetical protein
METIVDNQICGSKMGANMSPSHFTERSQKSWTDKCGGTGGMGVSGGSGNSNCHRKKKKAHGQGEFLTSSFKGKKNLMLRSDSSLSNSSSSDGFESYFVKK